MTRFVPVMLGTSVVFLGA